MDNNFNLNINNDIKYLGFGAPMMDIIAEVDLEFINRHNLRLNDTIHVKKNETEIFNIIEKEVDVFYALGGCVYNTMRMFNVSINIY